MKIIFSLLLLAVATTARAQQNMPMPDMAKTDITAMQDFDGANVCFRGLHLGMSKEKAIQKLDSFNDFTWDIDAYNTKSVDPANNAHMRIYVHLKNKAGVDDPTVLYLQWEEGKQGMHAMVFYKAVAISLAGRTAMLFTDKALDASCVCRKFLRGEPVKTTDNIGVNLYAFPLQHFYLISMSSGFGGGEDVWFKFVL